MIITHNILAYKMNNNIRRTEAKIAESLEKLATGQQINNSGDNPAALSISTKLKSLSLGLSQAEANVDDALSMLNVADGCLSDISENLRRLKELAVQMSNDTVIDSDRISVQKEIDQIVEKMRQSFVDAQFNTIPIFDQNIHFAQLPLFTGLTGDTRIVPTFPFVVTNGKNSDLSFEFNGDEYTISLQGSFNNIDALVVAINDKIRTLNIAGNGSLERLFVSATDQHLTFNTPLDGDIIDSFGGNMVNIDSPSPYTSILYDNIRSGSHQSAYIVGCKDIVTNRTIIDNTNDTLQLVVNGHTLNLTLEHGDFDSTELVAMLNRVFQDYPPTGVNDPNFTNGLPITADILNNKYLMIRHNSFESTDTLRFVNNLTSSPANDPLFNVSVESVTYYPAPFKGSDETTHGVTPAHPDVVFHSNSISGGSIIIPEYPTGANTLILKVGDKDITVDFTASDSVPMSLADICARINEVAKDNIATFDSTNNWIEFAATATSTTVSSPSGGYVASLLFGVSSPTTSADAGVWQFFEGQTDPLLVTKGYISGGYNQILASGEFVVIAGENDTFEFTLNGKRESVTISAGNYKTGSDLATALNEAFQNNEGGTRPLSVAASYANGRLTITNTFLDFYSAYPTGFTYDLQGFAGNGYEYFMHSSLKATETSTYIPEVPAGTAAAVQAYVYSQPFADTDNIVITDANNLLQVANGTGNVWINLDTGTYTIDEIVDMLNTSSKVPANPDPTKLYGNLQDIGMTASVDGDRIKLTNNVAKFDDQISIDPNNKNLIFNHLNIRIDTAINYGRSVTAIYADGRVDLSQPIDIFTGINDVFSFDVHEDNTVTRYTVTIPEGLYTGNQLAEQLNQLFSEGGIPVIASATGNIVTANTTSFYGLRLSYNDPNTFSTTTRIDGVGGTASYTIFYPGENWELLTNSNSLVVHVGANSGQNMEIGIPIVLNTRLLGVEGLSVISQSVANNAISRIDTAVSKVSSEQSKLGAKMNALEGIKNNLRNTHLNITSADSRIRDTSVAMEYMNLMKEQTLHQANILLLSQANNQPQSVLSLLRN